MAIRDRVDRSERRFEATNVEEFDRCALLAAQGDDFARRDLVSRLEPLVQGVAWRACTHARRLGIGDEVEHDDMVQEARTEIWRLMEGFDASRGPALAYFVVRIGASLRHHVTAIARRRWPGRRISWEDGGAEMAAQVLGVHATQAHVRHESRAELYANVATALQQLSVRHRRVLFFTYWRGMDDRAIGQTMGINNVAARQLRHRAIANLRQHLGQWHHSPAC